MNKKIWLSTILASVWLQGPAIAGTTILGGEVVDNVSWLDNFDFIDNSGTLNNYNYIINQGYSSYLNAGYTNNTVHGLVEFQAFSTLNNAGVFDNFGLVSVKNNVSIMNTGTYFNYGTTENNTCCGFSFTNQNILNNAGILSSTSPESSLLNNAQLTNVGEITGFGSMTTSGVIDNYAKIATDFYSSGMHITTTGVINNGFSTPPPFLPAPYGHHQADIIIKSTLNNEGVINNTSEGAILLDDFIGAAINNSGVIHNAGLIVGGNSRSTDSKMGVINNTGEINNAQNGRIVTDAVVSTGIINNDGVISANTIEIQSGVLAGTGTVVIDGHFNDYGTEITGFGMGTLVLTENATLQPNGNFTDWRTGELVNDFTGQMDIFGNLQLDGTLAIDIDLTMATASNENYYDSVLVNGNVVLGPDALLDIDFTGYGLLFEESLTLMTANSISGEFFNNNYFHDGNWYGWDILSDGYMDTLSFGLIPEPVPVPAAVWLFASGLFGLAAFARRKI